MNRLSRPWSASSLLMLVAAAFLLLTMLTLAILAAFMLWLVDVHIGQNALGAALIFAAGAVLFVSLLIVIGLAVVVRRLLTRPMQEVAAAMEQAEYVDLSRGGQSIRELQLIAAHYNSMLDGARARSRGLDRKAQVDSLTQLVNHSRLEAELEVEQRRAERYGNKFSLILLDIDHFKQINDLHGHLRGDEVLRTLADCMAARVRSADTLGRWGGEEFVVLCRQTSIQRAERLAESIRAVIEGAELPDGLNVTASCGVAGFQAGDSAETLFARADRALMQAKKAGRNRVMTA